MGYSNAAWDGSASRFSSTEAFCKACLIDTNPSGEKIQANCKLPVKEPNGDINVHALGAAAAALAGARGGLKDVSAADRKAAARKLISYYHGAKMEPPDSLKRMSGS